MLKVSSALISRHHDDLWLMDSSQLQSSCKVKCLYETVEHHLINRLVQTGAQQVVVLVPVASSRGAAQRHSWQWLV